MSQQEIWAVVGRAKSDVQFAGKLWRDFDGAVKEAGYQLTPTEIATAKAALNTPSGQQQGNVPLQSISDTFKVQQQEIQKRFIAQNERMIELNQFTVDILKETIGHSADTFKKVTLMNQVMFWMGVVMFGIAVIYAAVFKNLDFTGVFAGLGAASFIGFFFLGPIKKTQAALSNLIQAEIAFMNHFEQMGLLETFASIARDNAPGLADPDRVERASELMQLRSTQTIALLQKYLEDDTSDLVENGNRRARTAAKKPAAASPRSGAAKVDGAAPNS